MSSEFRVRSSVCCRAALIVLALAMGLASAEDAAGKKSTDEWIKQLGADKFAEREAATKALIALGAEAEPLVKKALDNPDNEVRRRAARVMAALTPVDFSGEFVRIGSESVMSDGRVEEAVNEKGKASIKIANEKVVLSQTYSNMKIDQTYSLPKDAKIDVRGKSELKLVWVSISQAENYYPDSGSPSLILENTPAGPRVTFEAKDTNGTGVKMLFARQADIDKDPALKAAVKAQSGE